MKKSILSCCLVSSFLLSGLTAHAAGTGDNPVYTEDVKSDEQLIGLQNKENQLSEWKNEKLNIQENVSIAPLALDEGYYKTLAVPSYKQETSYWCGPATTKQVLNFLNGSSSSQTTIASALGTTTAGTDFSLIDDYLNNNQNKTNYYYSTSPTYATWSDRVEYGLDHNYPVILDLTISPSYMPKYSRAIAGHILNVSGVDTKNSTTAQVRLTDPFDEGSRGVTLGNVWHAHKGVYDANMSHFRKAMIW